MWSSSQKLTLSSANSKIPTRKIPVRWKLPWLTSQPRQTRSCSGFQHTAGSKEMSKLTGLPGREASWNKRTNIPPILMKRPSSKPSPRKKWKQQHPNYNQSDSLHKLNRTEQVLLFRLRTGHNRLNAHRYDKFKAGESEMCPRNADIMRAEHLLQQCQLH